MSYNTFKDEQFRKICSEKTLQSNSKGFFLDFYNLVAEEVGIEWIKGEFGKLKTDEERIEFVYKSKQTGKYIENYLKNVQEVFRPKNVELSRKLRLDAEKLLNQQDYDKALIFYSQSVMRAPKTGYAKQIDQGVSLALSLWGRSQVLLHLHQFENSLADIQEACKEKLPASYKAQAFWNMGICYTKLGDEMRASVSFDLGKKLLSNNAEKVQKLLEDKQKWNKTEENPRASNLTCEKPKIEISNPNLPNASVKLSLKKSPGMGRYVVANQNISTGETLIIEPPYAACLLPEMAGTHCHHCFQRLKSPIGCHECSNVAFCCGKCRDEAMSTYHQYECKYLDLLFGSGMSILGYISLRIITQKGLKKCLQIYENRNNERLYKLCTNSDSRSPEDFLQRTLMAAFLLRCLQRSGFFGTDDIHRVKPTQVEVYITSMLLFNLQMLQFNAHEIFETRYVFGSARSSSKNVCIGVGVYETASMFNHDCHLALSRYFSGKNIVLTSIRPLKKNDLIPENYGPLFTKKSLAERKRSLLSRYWFDCCCLACQQNWPLIDRGLQHVSGQVRCITVSCSNLFSLPIKNNEAKCMKCGNTINLSERISMLKWCEEQYSIARELEEKSMISQAIDLLCKTINTFYKISAPPHKEIQLAEEMLARCFENFGNLREEKQQKSLEITKSIKLPSSS
ncbi:SET and MYND domain-containing protein 4-like [Euwallacea fornicatus]|uniref:SET and MYND domain-containing protein 4-like n=1 Tax=Euwallacea fornicatus TaxID=995702 RepID=UPI00338E6E26